MTQINHSLLFLVAAIILFVLSAFVDEYTRETAMIGLAAFAAAHLPA